MERKRGLRVLFNLKTWLGLLLILGTPFVSLAAHAPFDPTCLLSTVQKIPISIYPKQTNSPVYSLSYQYYPPLKKGLPTVIVVPGGPGVGLILDWKSPELREALNELGVPKDYGLIFSEPRGVGCNEADEATIPTDSLTTENLAYDLLTIIRHNHLNNYVIYGHSYGTAVSTVLANLAENDGGPKPRAVILTGTIDSAKTGVGGSIYSFEKTQWDALKTRLPKQVLTRISDPTPPLGLSQEVWSQFIELGLYLAYRMDNGVWNHFLYDSLMLLNSNSPKKDAALLKTIRDFTQEEDNDPAKWGDRLWNKIECDEFTDTEPEIKVIAGELLPLEDSDICVGRGVTLPYDSKNYPIRSPLYYFEGTLDPATPFDQGYAHYINNASFSGTDSAFVGISGGGHARLGAYFQDCIEPLWGVILSGNKSALPATIHSCVVSKKTLLDVQI